MKKILTFELFTREPQTRRVTEQLGKARGLDELRALLQKHGSDIVEGIVGDIAYWQVPPPFDIICVNMENIYESNE